MKSQITKMVWLILFKEAPLDARDHVIIGFLMFATQAMGTEALKGHRVLWKIEICYLIRMT